ncbi:hypothetical protein HK096_005167 [Nowakowskiella sp. JEL0078]|nr:hypothetical protein HK096_005167 [Nowakowskiella sp. JEL0078]
MIPRPIHFPQHRPTQQHRQHQPQQVQVQQVQQQQQFFPQTQFSQQQMLPQQQVIHQQQPQQQYQQPIQMYINQPTLLTYDNNVQYFQQHNNQLNHQLFQLQAQQTQLPNNLQPQFQQQSAIDPSLLLQFPIKQELDTSEFSIPSEFLIADNDAMSTLKPSPSHLSAEFTNIMSPLSASPLDPPDFSETVEDFSANGSGASLNQSPFASTPIEMKSRTSTSNTPNSHVMPKLQNANVNPGFYSVSMPVKANGFGINGASSYGSFGSTGIGSFSDLPLEGPIDSFVEMNSDNRLEIINERRRRRRESHNAVERRRRDNINEKIQELATLLPDLAQDVQNKPNKGVILRRSVDYIRHIQSYTMKLEQRHRELESAIRQILPGRESELGLSFILGSAIDFPPYYTPGQSQQSTPPPPTIQQQQQYQLEQMQFHQQIMGLPKNGQQQLQQHQQHSQQQHMH